MWGYGFFGDFVLMGLWGSYSFFTWCYRVGVRGCLTVCWILGVAVCYC